MLNFYFVSAIIAACHGYPYGRLCSEESGVSQAALLREGGSVLELQSITSVLLAEQLCTV